MRHDRAALAFAALWLYHGPASAQDLGEPPHLTPATDADAATAPPKLLDLPLEDLLTIESTSVAKKRQRVSESAAAVYVITREDIRRSAARTIPDLLRGIPGVEVAQPFNTNPAVTIRGFNSILANSLLVMIDGRSIYVSTFSGVFWDQLLIPLSDIERIEVVRGPGAALWGANAVNGVINIITRHSADTLDTRVEGRAGNRDQEISVSQGGRLTEALSYRLYGALRRNEGMVDKSGSDAGAAGRSRAIGGRIDWEPNEDDAITLQGDFSSGHANEPKFIFNGNLLQPGSLLLDGREEFHAGSALARWAHKQSEKFDWSVQAYYERTIRDNPLSTHLHWELADLDLAMHWDPAGAHDLNWGVGARIMHDSATTGPLFSLSDPSRTDRWVSGYVQDDISIVPDKVRLTVGAKVEHNNFTGFEFQPSVRLFVRPDRHLAFWGAVSRAVRTPSRFERSAMFMPPFSPPGSEDNPGPIPVYTEVRGRNAGTSEKLTAYELGLRADMGAGWSVDVAGYYNRYDRLATVELVDTTLIFVPQAAYPVGLRVDLGIFPVGKARTYGVEAVLKGSPTPWWQTELSWSHFDFSISRDPKTGDDFSFTFPLDYSPRNQISWRNNFDLSSRLTLSTQIIHVDRLSGPAVPGYTDLNLRAQWQMSSALSLSLVGENLFHDQRLEFSQNRYPAPDSYQPRRVSAQVRLRF
ncbi:TonB-dependent receptor plug domain-containing protein [Novosphingobium kaempferiae]|uniref:TonB-dependent receptor plug domain-containing protein n=1 Tax=Novosphingobium kaempferiae TaxID=2896849 RepID=UPI001E2C03E7|nr:TonB-dependent receptor [Novosphingobium kaempferiae]